MKFHIPIGGTNASLPSGVIIMYGSLTPPLGWLLCDGRAISRSTYSGLWQVIGTVYGGGDGSTTFNLPSFTNQMVRGNTPGNGAGTDTHAHTSTAHAHTSAAHLHTMTPGTIWAQITLNGAVTNTVNHNRAGGSYTGNVALDASPGAVGRTVAMPYGTGVDGQSDSTTPGNTGSTTPGNVSTQSNLPAYTAAAFIIKT